MARLRGRMTVWPEMLDDFLMRIEDVAYSRKRNKAPIPDFIFDDLSHRADDVEKIARFAMNFLPPGGFFVIHDTLAKAHAEQVMVGLRTAGMAQAGLRNYMIEPSDCGIGVWRKPQKEQDDGNASA